MGKVVAIVVTFHPRVEEFQPLLDRLRHQADAVIVVDNTPGATHPELETIMTATNGPTACSLIRFGGNAGLARALNVGCQTALASGADFLLLSDQDSLPSEDMVHGLCRAYRALSETGFRVGAVGPTYTDLHTGLTYPFQARLPGRLFYGHKVATGGDPHVEALTLITSGTLIPAAVFEEVGPMREDFFIDQIDVEWCHRARWKGYRLFGTGWATMHQRMGKTSLRVWYLRWRQESFYSPLRLYYRLRNFVALLKLDHIDWRWKLRSCWYHLGLLYSHVVFGPSPLEAIKMCCKGIWHGLSNKMGAAGGTE